MAGHCVRHFRGSPPPAPTAHHPSHIFSHLPQSPWAQMELQALEWVQSRPAAPALLQPPPARVEPTACWRQGFSPYPPDAHPKGQFQAVSRVSRILTSDTFSPRTPSDAFPSFSFLYMQMCPFPWAMSALPFSREASLCLATSFWCQKGLEEGGGRAFANDSEGKIDWELCPKIWFCYTDSTVGFIPDSFPNWICLQTQKHSISEPSSAEGRTSLLPVCTMGVPRQGCQCIWN